MLSSQLASNDNALHLMAYASFRFHVPEDVYSLALMIASCCPQQKKVRWGIQELLLNALEHGNLNIGYDEKKRLLLNGKWNEELARRLENPLYKGKFGTLEYEKTAQSIIVTISDQGEGFAVSVFELDSAPSETAAKKITEHAAIDKYRVIKL